MFEGRHAESGLYAIGLRRANQKRKIRVGHDGKG